MHLHYTKDETHDYALTIKEGRYETDVQGVSSSDTWGKEAKASRVYSISKLVSLISDPEDY